VILSVAFDSGGIATVRDFIKPAEPVRIEPLFQDIMGWDTALCDRAAAPTYPNLIDEHHLVAELYNMTNVPMAVWIDERGNIVRPAEAAGTSDGFRSMDRSTFRMKKEAAERGRAIRMSYVDAIRDWVARGEASEYVLSADEIRRRINAPVNVDPVATANFRIGQYLHQQGHLEDAKRYFQETRRLCPERWNYLRQTMQLEEDGSASGPDFFRAIDALGERPFYAPVELKGRRA
jgi:predicted nucleic acid-binding protein